jgi:hypothetical protein
LFDVFSLVPQHAGLILRVHVVWPVGWGRSCTPSRIKGPRTEGRPISTAPTKTLAEPGSDAPPKTAAPAAAQSSAGNKSSAVGRAVTCVGRVAKSSSSSGHWTGTHWSCSVKSWHMKHLLFSIVRRASHGGVVLCPGEAFQNDPPRS